MYFIPITSKHNFKIPLAHIQTYKQAKMYQGTKKMNRIDKHTTETLHHKDKVLAVSIFYRFLELIR